MGPWTVPYFFAGLFFAVVACRSAKGELRLPCITFTLALFFSLSLAVGRTAVPLPTLVAACLWAMETAQLAFHPPECRLSVEGCMAPDQGAVLLVLVPFLVQWAVLHVLLMTASFVWRAIVARRNPKDGNALEEGC